MISTDGRMREASGPAVKCELGIRASLELVLCL